MSEHAPFDDDAAFRARLQAAVAASRTGDGDWNDVARRVRRHRAGGVALRVAVPALAVVLAVGGLWVAARRRGTTGPADIGTSTTVADGSVTSTARLSPAPPTIPSTFPAGQTTAVATPTSSPTNVTTTHAATTGPGPSSTTRDPPSATATPTEGLPSTWTRLGTSTVAGHTLDVTGFALAPEHTCVGVRSSTTPIADLCRGPDRWVATEVDGELYVTGTRVHAGDVVVHSSVGDDIVPAFAFNGLYVFGARVPDGADLLGIDDGPRVQECSYRQVIAALSATGWIVDGPFPVRVEACAGGVAGVTVGGSTALLQGAAAILQREGDVFKALNLGGVICERPGTSLTPEQQARLDAELAACDKIGWRR